jgi:IS5 family transposase
LRDALKHYAGLANKVLSQTRRRVFDGESVPAQQKIVSIFEPHTDIIRKDRRDTLYGHKVFLTTGASGLIIDCVVERGNPTDSTRAVTLAKRAIKVLDAKPEQVVFDGGFSSRDNLNELKELGIRDVVFSKAPGIAIKEMIKRTWLYQRLRHFRAGIEGIISFLKRSFGWDRCAWRSYASFRAYTLGSVIAANLVMLARHALGT